MSELAQKKYEEATATEVKKKTDVTQQKLYSIIFVCIAFVVLYFAANSGSETFMWLGLGVMTLSQVVMYIKN